MDDEALQSNLADGYIRVAIPTGSNVNTTTRQIYIPVDGDYYLVVLDARNNTDTPAMVGGNATVTYTAVFQHVTLTPTAVTLPSS